MTTVERPIVQTFRLSEDERATLEALAEHEERPIGDVIRRALRAYAEELGVLAKRTKKAPRKAQRKTALPPKGRTARGGARAVLSLDHPPITANESRFHREN